MPSCMAWIIPSSTPMTLSTDSRIAFLCCVSFFLLLVQQVAHADLTGDAQALLAFKGNVTHGANLAAWNSSNTNGVCTWKGVTCSSGNSQRVVELRLPGSSLVGSIPEQTLGNLDALQVLSLRKNKLSGTFPSDLARCVALAEVNLKGNSFSGALLFDFSAWPSLQKLDLSSNNFSGQIPSSLSNLALLDSLLLEDNLFSGSIPSINSTHLRSFNVSNNRLNGSIPRSLSHFETEVFSGNPQLCGSPLAECQSTGGAPPPSSPPISSLPPGSSPGDGSSGLPTGAVVGIILGCMAILIIFASICLLFFTRKNEKQAAVEGPYAEGRSGFESKTKDDAVVSRKTSGRSGTNEGGSVTININNKLTFVGNAKQAFDLDDLLRASAEVLGKGTLGTSYRATVDEGVSVCVKRFREVDAERQYTCKHIEMLGSLQHPNLVPLRAYFFAVRGKLLVSDYMPKGSLSSLLHGNKREVREPLDWQSRLAIAEGTAKGLVFLHSKKVVHGNVKSSNVVMDADMEARLTDYSMIQLVPLKGDEGATLRPSAYTPPESREDPRKVTYKGDVYSFGVLLLELVTGRSPNSGSLTQGGSKIDRLVEWVRSHFPHDSERVLDPRLSTVDNLEKVQDDMVSLLQIAIPCISSAPDKRPHMVEIVSSIGNLRKPPEFTDIDFSEAD
ncbi:hypothetical protein KP509_03G006000 [Ceratopteris richardii]|uniref:Protein kinase domain-containing protein n=1 Tax=Ceratopteris richardii TaxID=49495 RepID=A0A8T2V0Q2_CERRI|nr:hypothetical protein KP509_03G006000 [Ceratopteris richardii]